MIQDTLFLEVDFSQCRKHGQYICGDAFQSQRLTGGTRIIAALSDGLGSGVKANILSSMTAAMALKFVAGKMDFLRSASIMMDALPVCQVRKISYATFTIVDCTAHGKAQLIQMDNPPYLFIRDGAALSLNQQEMASPRWSERVVRFARTDTQPEDRIVMVSDGITQAGLGSPAYPLGWRDEGLAAFVLQQIAENAAISARDLSERVIREALAREPRHLAQDDMTCGVVYFRRPRKLIVLTGPPFDPIRDREFACMLDEFDGRKVICGGTTTTIISRMLGRPVTLDLSTMTDELPPQSVMQGVDLITEGILTLTKTAQLLESGVRLNVSDPEAQLAQLLIESDVIRFVVGSRINEAHQDPTLPMDLEIRRNIVKRVARILEDRYLKETHITRI